MQSRVKIKQHANKATKKLDVLSKKLAKNNSIQVGLLKGSKDYPDGTSVVTVGAVHEFGSPARNIPERSFLRHTLIVNKKAYRVLFRKLAVSVVNNKLSMVNAMDKLGSAVKVDVKRTVISKNILNTGHLLQSIAHKIGKADKADK